MIDSMHQLMTISSRIMVTASYPSVYHSSDMIDDDHDESRIMITILLPCCLQKIDTINLSHITQWRIYRWGSSRASFD